MKKKKIQEIINRREKERTTAFFSCLSHSLSLRFLFYFDKVKIPRWGVLYSSSSAPIGTVEILDDHRIKYSFFFVFFFIFWLCLILFCLNPCQSHRRFDNEWTKAKREDENAWQCQQKQLAPITRTRRHVNTTARPKTFAIHTAWRNEWPRSSLDN